MAKACLKNSSPIQPIRCKTKTNGDFIRYIFPRLAPVTWICFVLSLAHLDCVVAFVVIGHCSCFGFGVKTLNWKPLCFNILSTALLSPMIFITSRTCGSVLFLFWRHLSWESWWALLLVSTQKENHPMGLTCHFEARWRNGYCVGALARVILSGSFLYSFFGLLLFF